MKEGLEQGAKNLDSFKGFLKKTKGLGDNIYHSLSTYRKQLTRHLQNTVDEGLLNLSKATQEGLERAKQFTLEVPTVVVRETSTGSQMMRFEKMSKSLGDTGLGKSLDNLASKAKNVENASLSRLQARNAFKSVDEFEDSLFDGNLIIDYVKDIKLNTNRDIPNNQIESLKNALRNKKYKKLTPIEVSKHRAEFNRIKNSLIDEWELKTGQNWPIYSEDVIGKNGNIVRKAGSKYDAHHIIENSYGGNNEWWNIHPARFPNEHQAGIHRAGSPARELFK
ncbi:hypothetical protein SORDD15_00663 [Streptococcus oralis]|uniref:HNH endonuclease n=1 Tax=Streptococcus oralis TaxID=1303 RepID=A0A139NZT9_STROR|nr:hypothetical protein SORDD15_00663 [Streptococcus oralis]